MLHAVNEKNNDTMFYKSFQFCRYFQKISFNMNVRFYKREVLKKEY